MAKWMDNGPCQACGHKEEDHNWVVSKCTGGCECKKFACQWCNVPAPKLRELLCELLEEYCKANCTRYLQNERNRRPTDHTELCKRIVAESGVGHGHYT